jgi:Domain of unknown function (DUF4203)
MILAIVVGLALLFFGRQLFWLFVGGVGFAAGLALATKVLEGQPDWLVLAIALLAGLIGALLSIFVQRLAIGLAGFFAGGYALLTLATKLGYQDWAWLAFLGGGALGALLVVALFDWALILLSALTGALLVVNYLPLEPAATLLVFAVLLVAGLAAQAGQLKHRVSQQPVPDRG